MGILNLRFGYFARGGAATVIDDPSASYNARKRNALLEFGDWFAQNRRALQAFMPADALKHGRPSFEILSDNTRFNTENLRHISTLSDCRFSIIVSAVIGDIRNANAQYLENNREPLIELYRKTSNFEIQIFNLTDELAPLSRNILQGKRGSKAAFYLMENASRSREALEYWHARACQPA